MYKGLKKSDTHRERASLIWGFAMPILDKQAEVLIQKLLKLEELLFKIIFKSTVI
jgi:hypothetical protein